MDWKIQRKTKNKIFKTENEKLKNEIFVFDHMDLFSTITIQIQVLRGGRMTPQQTWWIAAHGLCWVTLDWIGLEWIGLDWISWAWMHWVRWWVVGLLVGCLGSWYNCQQEFGIFELEKINFLWLVMLQGIVMSFPYNKHQINNREPLRWPSRHFWARLSIY